MTGNVHDRAIAEELRRIARVSRYSIDAQDVVPVWDLNHRADQLEAAAPPTAVDPLYDGEQPPVGSVLVNNDNCQVIIRIPQERDGNDWLDTDDDYGTRWEFIRRDLFGWTVLRWGLV